MTRLITNKFREHLNSQFIESITEPANNVYYVVAAKHTPYANNDATPSPSESVKETHYDLFNEGIFGKKITSSDVSLMIPRYNWTSNTIYTPYDDTSDDLYNSQFYVVVDAGATYYVYKCLDNNLGSYSTVEPSNLTESACSFITTPDGYTWKLMYKMAESNFEKFATSSYMPVVTSSNVAGNTVSGAIDVIKITNTGSSYVTYLTGQFNSDDLRESISVTSGNTTTYRLSNTASANNGHYVGSAIYISSGAGAGQIRSIVSYNGANKVAVVNTSFTAAPSTNSTYIIAPNVSIDGDGNNATAYATVSSNATVNNFISKINIVNRGSNYSYATAIVTGNTGGSTNTASLRVIIPPQGGHGKNAPEELGSDALGVSVTFSNNESGFITTENDFRQFVLLKDPLFNNVKFTIDTDVGVFTVGETIHQIDYVTLTGTASCNVDSQDIVGIATEFNFSLASGDYVKIFDAVSGFSCLRSVTGVGNSTVFSVNANPTFTTSSAKISKVSILASGVKTGNSSPYIELSNVEPKFITGKQIIGSSSGAVGNLVSITVSEKAYNSWNTFDNRTRIGYSASFGSMPEDNLVFQSNATSNAYFHSANDTFVFLTSADKIQATSSLPLQQSNGFATFTLTSTKYSPDIVKGSGRSLYIENTSAISRSNSQSELFKLTLKL